MAGDSEKRFHSIMDKLFRAPKSIPTSSSCSRAESTSGVKRRNVESALALVDPKSSTNVVENYQNSLAGSTGTPLCRPWDRGDLMRRLATFKSMTWFAKPKVVSAVNCARRGWVNVDTDFIACESCGARLLFSTPSSWTHQQVEKAALVFSLKLDNEHKLLCPWIDNACDEMLAQFPPTPPPILVDKFRERSSKLLQLLALPVISSSSIESIRNPQIDEFLKQSLAFEHGNDSLNDSQSDPLNNESEDQSANLYYQAQNLISLCGWEPRSLAYVVECEDTAGGNEIVEATENSGAHKSVVLDCRLCGASVGLWAFSTVPRPVEFYRLVGYTEVSGEGNAGNHASGTENHIDNREGVNTSSNIAPFSKETSSGLNLTIAGGPPPTKQNFKATISLPIVGRALRARFSNDSEFRGCTYDHHEEIQSAAMNKILSLDGKECEEHNLSEQIVRTKDPSLLNSKQSEHEPSSSISEDHCPCLDHNGGEKSDAPENNNHMPAEGKTVTELVPSAETGPHNSLAQNATQTTQNPGLSQNDGLLENAANVELIDSADERIVTSGVKDLSIITADPNFTIVNGVHSKNGSSLMVTSDNAVMARITGKDLKRQSEDNRMKFDPIRQHRHFCPWIISTGSGPPGWQQTLSALQRKRDHSHSSPTNSPPSTSIIKVDDPIDSVRKLFTSPVTKRIKTSHGSK